MGYWYHIPTVVLSCASFISALYVCISAYMLHKLHIKETKELRNVFINRRVHSGSRMSTPHPLLKGVKPMHTHYWETQTLITHHIFWMTFCDSLFSLWAILTWSPQLLFDKFIFSKPGYLCTISAVWVTSTSCAGTLWYLVIAYCLFCIIFSLENRCSDISNPKIKIYHSVFVWVLTVALCLIIALLKGYGDTTNIHDEECGTLVGKYQVIIYGVFMFTVSFAICLFLSILYRMYIKPCIRRILQCLCCCKNNEHNQHYINDGATVIEIEKDSDSDILVGISIKKKELVLRLTEFTFVFIICWVFPIIDRIHRWINNDQSPQWMAISHNWFLVSIGFGNAIVWMKSKSFQSFYESQKMMRQIDDNCNFHENNSSMLGKSVMTASKSPDTTSFKKRMLL